MLPYQIDPVRFQTHWDSDTPARPAAPHPVIGVAALLCSVAAAVLVAFGYVA